MREWSTLKRLIWHKAVKGAAAVWRTVTGAVVSFTTRKAKPVQDMAVAIEPVQSGSGDPSPTNVRPITGWTGAKVTRTGKNLVGLRNANKDATATVIEIVGDSLHITNTSSTRYVGAWWWKTGILAGKTLPIQKLRLSFDAEGTLTTNWIFGLRRVNGNTFVVGQYVNFSTSGHYSVTIDLTSLTEDVYLSVCRTGNETSDVDVTFSNIQLELGETETDYEPYSGNTYEVDWATEAGTVYGGTLDVTTGVLTVKKRILEVTSSLRATTVSMTTGVRYAFYSSNWGDNLPKVGTTSAENAGEAISSHFIYGESGVVVTFGVFRIATDGTLNFYDSNSYFADISEFKSWADDQADAGTPVQICVLLATPLTYQLTPTEVNTILGQNNIWADTGDTTVTYRES